jgi:hypothetical protein
MAEIGYCWPFTTFGRNRAELVVRKSKADAFIQHFALASPRCHPRAPARGSSEPQAVRVMSCRHASHLRAVVRAFAIAAPWILAPKREDDIVIFCLEPFACALLGEVQWGSGGPRRRMARGDTLTGWTGGVAAQYGFAYCALHCARALPVWLGAKRRDCGLRALIGMGAWMGAQ